MHKAVLVIDKFFLKYEEGVRLITLPFPPKKVPSKSPALLGLNKDWVFECSISRKRIANFLKTVDIGLDVQHANLFLLQFPRQSVFISFKIKFYKNLFWELNKKIELFCTVHRTSNWFGKSLMINWFQICNANIVSDHTKNVCPTPFTFNWVSSWRM